MYKEAVVLRKSQDNEMEAAQICKIALLISLFRSLELNKI